MQKYQKYYIEMVEQNKKLFDSFRVIHDNFVKDEKKWKNDFNTVGEEVVSLIREWENKLCSKTEGGCYTKFSTNLSEKFWVEVRRNFSHIDLVGVK